MENFNFNSNNEYMVSETVHFNYLVDEDNDPMSWMGIKQRSKDASKKFFYKAEVLEEKFIGRWATDRACTKCRIIEREEI